MSAAGPAVPPMALRKDVDVMALLPPGGKRWLENEKGPSLWLVQQVQNWGLRREGPVGELTRQTGAIRTPPEAPSGEEEYLPTFACIERYGMNLNGPDRPAINRLLRCRMATGQR